MTDDLDDELDPDLKTDPVPLHPDDPTPEDDPTEDHIAPEA